MSDALSERLAALAAYARGFGDRSQHARPPARRFAILACMDARLYPAGHVGLTEGDAHGIRNAGGRASDGAIRSLVIPHKLLGTRERFVVHHSDCGMQLFDDAAMSGLLATSLHTAELTEAGWRNPHHDGGSVEGRKLHRLTFTKLEPSVIGDVERIRRYRLVPSGIPTYGLGYDVRSGRLVEVPRASEIGLAGFGRKP